ncbi:MAG: tRNA (N6-threonylcarbamoyladenosine(37)-N6)-methyltransferase TrmO [Desulfobacca sp.]|uniref:tRNA (N6-threonylcarbamoyladenosine(37)-N6)-methyltransferase TrmO n=1 Tax=Desulfobacca sp. TaxID=2067990 RepID=UPI004049BDD4
MTPIYLLQPIGYVHRAEKHQEIEVAAASEPALLGIERYSHLWIIYWFHEHDNPQDRSILQVHPCRNPANPLTGVFGTRAPVRPNLLGLCAVRLLRLAGLRLLVTGLDARDGTPVLDIKPYLSSTDAIAGATAPSFLSPAAASSGPRELYQEE